MSYLADVTNALSQSNGQGPSQLSVDGEERAIEVDSDWVEELAVEEEDSQAEDSVSTDRLTARAARGRLECWRTVTLTSPWPPLPALEPQGAACKLLPAFSQLTRLMPG